MQQNYICVIVDDNEVDRKILESHLKRITNLILIDAFSHFDEALPLLHRGIIDILFIDIETPKLTGIELLKALKTMPQTILTSAHSEYCLDAFEVGVTDYLLKPYSFDRFLKAVSRAMGMLQLRARAGEKSVTPSGEFVFLKSGRESLKFNLQDIIYFEALASFSKVFTSVEKYILISESISEIQYKFPENYFIRIHKSYLVSKNKIIGISPKQIILDNIKIPLGLSYRNNVEKVLSFKN